MWRPLNNAPLEDHPLAVCDSRSVLDSELLECDLVYPDYEGEHFKVKYSGAHRWYYWRHQIRDEVILIQNFDSDGTARKRCSHVPRGAPTIVVSRH